MALFAERGRRPLVREGVKLTSTPRATRCDLCRRTSNARETETAHLQRLPEALWRTRTADPSLPWKFGSVTRVHARSSTTSSLLQIRPFAGRPPRRETSRVSFLMCPFCVRVLVSTLTTTVSARHTAPEEPEGARVFDFEIGDERMAGLKSPQRALLLAGIVSRLRLTTAGSFRAPGWTVTRPRSWHDSAADGKR